MSLSKQATGVRNVGVANELQRVASFSKWSSDAPRINSFALARNGLYFDGKDSIVCCHCGYQSTTTVDQQEILERHRRSFPACEYCVGFDDGSTNFTADNSTVYRTTGRDESDYVSDGHHRKQYPNNEFARTSRSPDPAVTRNKLSSNTEAYNASMQSHGQTVTDARATAVEISKHPEFADVQRRIQSFKPERLPRGQNAKVLAEAGFYFVGPVDNVRCFHCDGGLKNWQPDDEPWTEHRRWFPKCHYLQSNWDHRHNMATEIAMIKLSLQRDGMNPSLVVSEDAMTSPAVRAVLEMGFSNEVVQRAIHERIKKSGDMFRDAVSLLDAVMSIEDGEMLKSPITPSASSLSKHEPQAAAAAETPKNELPHNMPLASKLQAENREMREARKCKVCMDKEVDTVFLPCGHLSCCHQCSPALRRCPICRQIIRGTVKIYLS